MKNWRTILYHGSRLVLGALFCYAGVVKALDVVAFAGSVANYQLLPYQLNFLVAALLPYVELAAGLLLLLGRQVRPAVVLIAGMNGVFIVALLSVILRGLDIDCGCFRPGGEGHTSAQMALLRDVGIMLLALVTWLGVGRRND
ncbi:DoxX family protein [Syntrophotalea acetylenivorans]|uniref:DoxX family protein n=1 Tax=Syntrophotalea acetylenivorans TaxID=1842532 RepID=A0A1L3GS19_9BACT|nr:MauE/DoxX family redox-associated membrane protein [Syntrophotalea acetylenivorans]APG28727.1 DoxX family protein [Syntrophotalea acetylenivorans]